MPVCMDVHALKFRSRVERMSTPIAHNDLGLGYFGLHPTLYKTTVEYLALPCLLLGFLHLLRGWG